MPTIKIVKTTVRVDASMWGDTPIYVKETAYRAKVNGQYLHTLTGEIAQSFSRDYFERRVQELAEHGLIAFPAYGTPFARTAHI